MTVRQRDAIHWLVTIVSSVIAGFCGAARPATAITNRSDNNARSFIYFSVAIFRG